MDINLHVASPLNTISAHQINTHTQHNKESTELSTQDFQQIKQLKTRDRVVRTHESAHISAGAGIVRGGANFSFQRGSDSVQYAIGGEVKIDSAKVIGNPEATLQKAQQIQTAALAPAQPSSQDRHVAAKAAQMAVEARAEINQRQSNDKTTAEAIKSSSQQAEELTGNLLDLSA